MLGGHARTTETAAPFTPVDLPGQRAPWLQRRPAWSAGPEGPLLARADSQVLLSVSLGRSTAGWPRYVILEFLLEYRWSAEVSPFWNMLWNIDSPGRFWLRNTSIRRLSNLECQCIPDVTPGASRRERRALSFELPNTSNRVKSHIFKDLLTARFPFSERFSAILRDFERFRAILELRGPSKGLSVSIYSKICWNMLWNIDGPAGIS